MTTAMFLLPVPVLIFWTMLMWFALYLTRIPAMKAARIHPEKARHHDGDWKSRLPARTRSITENYNHLHEQPTLFYALMIVITLALGGNVTASVLAWLYVVLRIVHSVVQVSSAPVIYRFAMFFAASLMLLCLLLHSLWRWLQVL